MTGRVSQLTAASVRAETRQKNVRPIMVGPEKIKRRVPDFRNPGCHNLNRAMFRAGLVPESLTASARAALADRDRGKRNEVAYRHIRRASGSVIGYRRFNHAR